MRRAFWLALGLFLLASCEQAPRGVCGDGLVEADEECDDGNLHSADGCHRCEVEEGWQCHGDPSHCCSLHWQGPDCAGLCVVYVNGATQPASEDGLGWTTAFAQLQEGIDTAHAVGPECEVWVAAGSYHAWRQGPEDTFELPSHTALYGGFAGGELSRDERDWQEHATVLDGRRTGSPEERVQHVLTTSDASNVKVDGFTITGGDTAPAGTGGGLQAQDATVLVRNCLFTDNHAGHGAGIGAKGTGVLQVVNSRFLENSADLLGGGISAGLPAQSGQGVFQIEIDGCELEGNTARSGGALATHQAWSVAVSGSRFLDNHASEDGGAVHVTETWQEVRFTQCLLGGNEAEESGALHLVDPTSFDQVVLLDTVVVMNRAQRCGAMRLEQSFHWNAARVHGSVFAGNRAEGPTTSAGGVCLEWGGLDPDETHFTDTLFSANRAANGAGGLSSNVRSFHLTRTAFLGNSTGGEDPQTAGGAITVRGEFGWGYTAHISDSVFAGNHGRWGGAISSAGAYLDATNLSLVGNVADEEGGAIYAEVHLYQPLRTSNSILWNNQSPDGTQIAGTGVHPPLRADHCIVEGGYEGDANQDADPLFVAYPTPSAAGTWTQVSYDAEAFQTRLTDDGASWVPGELVGLFLKPSASDPRWLWIVDSDDTGIIVWANVAAWVSPGHAYAVYDLHLSPTSPAIDVGDLSTASATDFDGHPRVDVPGTGSATAIVDMGAYEYQP